MWVIERHAGDGIQIGDEIQVRVLDIDGDTVRLGIDAPRDIAVRAFNRAQPADAPNGRQDNAGPAASRDEGDE